MLFVAYPKGNFYKDFQPNSNQNEASENEDIICKFEAGFLSDNQPA